MRFTVLLALLVGLVACGGGASSASEAAVLASGTLATVGQETVPVPPNSTTDNSAAVVVPAATSATPAVASKAVGPQTLAVLVAQGDPYSEAVAQAYQKARGVPDANIVRLSVSTLNAVISESDFTQLRAELDAKLPATTQALLVTWDQPSRVQGPCAMSLTSALTFGFDARYCGGCNRTAMSPYYAATTNQPWTDLRLRPAMMLGAKNLLVAEELIARGMAADRSMTQGAQGQGWLVRTNDVARNSTRYLDFQTLARTAVPGITWHAVDNLAGTGSNVINQQSGVMFYFTGLARVGQIESNQYLPGAVADHLTSFGGLLPAGNGQMTVTDWLSAGLTGSYGTVEEPCNHAEKFPRASVMVDRYRRGDTLIEAYWKSVRWPGQGLFVGEPLARPWGP